VLRVPGGQWDSARHITIEGNLERVWPGAGKRDVEDEHCSGLHIDDTGRRFPELHRSFAAEELVSTLVHESDSDRVHADLGSPPADAQHEVRPRTYCRKAREPDVLKYAEDAQLALLVDEGVVGDEREVEMQGQATRIEVITSFCLTLLTTSIPCRT
jgi:hypothetical protein